MKGTERSRRNRSLARWRELVNLMIRASACCLNLLLPCSARPMGSRLNIHRFLSFSYNHLKSYPCPKNINFLWNQGFLLGVAMVLQLLSGIFLSFHYTPDINSAYYSLMHILREVYFGWSFRSLHSSGASFLFLLVFLHLGRALIYGSNFYLPKTWFSGICIFFLLAVNGSRDT